MTRRELFTWLAFFAIVISLLALTLTALKIKDCYIENQPLISQGSGISRVDSRGNHVELQEHFFNRGGKTYFFRGNWSYLDVVGILRASKVHGINVYFSYPWSDKFDYPSHPKYAWGKLAVYIEDVGDLSSFWNTVRFEK